MEALTARELLAAADAAKAIAKQFNRHNSPSEFYPIYRALWKVAEAIEQEAGGAAIREMRATSNG